MKNLFLIISLFFIFSCRKDSKVILNKANINVQKNKTTLFLENIPKNFIYKFQSGESLENQSFDIQYYLNDEVLNVKFEGINSKRIEEIKQVEEYIEITHSYNALDEISFLIKNGDSLKISYSKQKPNGKILNRNIKKYDLEYDYLVRKHVFKTKFPYYIQSKSNPLIYVDNVDSLFKTKTNLKTLKRDIYSKATKELKKEKMFLDSIYNIDEMSNIVYKYLDVKNRYNLYHVQLNNNDFDIKNTNGIVNDTLIKYKFYRDFIKNYATEFYQIETLKVSDGKVLDYKTAFNSLLNSNSFTIKTKFFLLFYYTEAICESFKNDEAKLYLEKYLNFTKNKYLYEKLKKSYFFKSVNIKTNNEIEFLYINKNQVNLNSITNKNKIVYIDFWASWCAPCRAAMPASKKLHEKYKNKDVEFVYVSIDKNFDAWQKANTKENLDIKKSFLAINYPEATFYKENQLKSIPRYMIYHKGKLVNNNAPAPDSPEIIKELDKYLAEE